MFWSKYWIPSFDHIDAQPGPSVLNNNLQNIEESQPQREPSELDNSIQNQSDTRIATTTRSGTKIKILAKYQ